MADLTYDEISKLLKYEPETGKLFWLPRPQSLFASTGYGGTYTAWKRWNGRFSGKEAFTTLDGKGYPCGSIYDRRFAAHRVAWLLHTGMWPTGYIDHVNGNPADNRICNLRDVSHLENMRNQKRQSSNKSGVCGVFMKGKKWVAHISYDGSVKTLGAFPDINDAIKVRKEAELKHGYHQNHGRD